MNKIQLNNEFAFSIEPYEKRVRLVVYNNKEEWVCRKETIKNIESFLEKEEASIFKGRLRLSKVNSKIFVEVKKEVVGSIKLLEFEALLKKLK
jgi:hypothetical protein